MKQISRSYKVWLTIIPCFVLLFGTFSPDQRAFANATTYYVNNQSGSNCNDTGAGTSTSAPWCTFNRVNAMTFGAGDKILLARGATWNQEMVIAGSGTSVSYAEIGAYGSGNRPKIIRNGATFDKGIKIVNPSYWKISSLEVANASVGIYVYFNTKSHDSLSFNDIYVHDMRGVWAAQTIAYPSNGNHSSSTDDPTATSDRIFMSSGILFTTSGFSFTSVEYAVRNVSITNLEGTHNVDSLSVDSYNGYNSSDGGDGNNLFQNFTMSNLYFHDDDGHAGVAYQNAGLGCSDSLRLSGVSNSIVMNSVLKNVAGCHTSAGTAAIFLGRASNIKLINNIITDTADTNSYDQTAVDHEYLTNNIQFIGNYIGRNAGPGVEYLNINSGMGVADHSTNEVENGNTFEGNGLHNKAGTPQVGAGSIFQHGSTAVTSGSLTNNFYNEGSLPFLSGDNISQITATNNINANSGLYNAMNGFSSTQGSGAWTYQYKPSGGSWSNLPYYNAAERNWYQDTVNPSNQKVSVSELHPGTCAACDVARVWTAPSAGTISIRGHLLKTDIGGGDGVLARITKNGSRIWPASADQTITYNDQSGVDSNLDNLIVAAGDLIRFEVGSNSTNSNDTTSWAPSIAYTSANSGSSNLAPSATVSVSTQYSSSYAGTKAVDGVIGQADVGEWASNGQTTPWIQLNWSTSQTLNSVKLYDRPNSTDTISAGTLTFSDSTLVSVGALPNNGTALVVSFPSKNVTWMKFTVTTGAGSNVGLSEIEAYATAVAPALVNAGFELPSTSTYIYGPMTNGWTFDSLTGVQHSGSAFGATAPEGVQCALIQYGGQITQTVNFSSAGSYRIAFQAAKRTNFGGQQSFDVYVDSTNVGSYTPATATFSAYNSSNFTVSAGTHTIKFVGTTTSDNTAFVDDVKVIMN
ncbi:hypothetical protein EHS13_10045 [Paenibacillus psychroresistens]|uniref:CBM6 domain-containing protein n=1 Tax=Paenibacillus psychroresistens TaxID=1778678 RepID=A0A6B8RI43_9BACL|nr:hypothetical protein [Paenibacillus psychroresistens]QGQ95203.1 hypothetical protein EHS13_10045 [Paenibacillus psychroresistens]